MGGSGGAPSTTMPHLLFPPTVFDPPNGRPPPLRTWFLLAPLGICHSRRLPTQGRRRSDPNGTSPTRSRRCDDASSSLSPGPFRDAPAAIRRSARRQEFPITDAVRLKHRT